MKKGNKVIYLLFNCDEWKSSSSMTLRAAATTETKIKKAVLRAIQSEEMLYRKDLGLSKSEQIRLFKEDWEKLTRDRLNDHLLFGFLEIAYDGEDI